jgi:outer membrane protein TolC
MGLKIYRKNFMLITVLSSLLMSCQNNNLDINKILSKFDVEKEIGEPDQQESSALNNVAGEAKELAQAKFKPFVSDNLKHNVTEAIIIHPLYIAERNKFEASKAYIKAAQSTKNMQASATLLGGLKAEDRKTDPSASLSVSLSKLIYDYGASDATILSVTEKSAMAEIMTLGEAEKIASRALGVWVELVKTIRVKKVYSDGLALAQPLLGQIKNISSAGVADKSELLEAQKKYVSLELGVEEVTAALIAAETKFLDIFPDADLLSVRQLDFPKVTLYENNETRLIENSIIIAGQELLIKSYEAELKASKLGAKPTVAVASSVNAPAKDIKQDGLATLGLSINYVFNDGGRRDADNDAIKANIANVENTKRNQILVDKMNLAVLIQQHKTSLKRVDTAREILLLAQEIADTAKGQLVTGRSRISDVMNARVATADAQISLINAETDLVLASYGIIGLLDGILNYLNWQKI